MEGLFSKKRPLIIIAGPTGVGKSSVAVEVCLRIGGEVVSADSMQVYRHMDIGSAKITVGETKGVPHHMIDVLDPTESFDVATFKSMAKACVEDIHNRGKVPVMAGGTGFYIQALLYDIDFGEGDEKGSGIRAILEKEYADKGGEVLYKKLEEVDAESASSIHPNNVKKVIRALEFFYLTGKKISSHNEEQRRRISPYDHMYFALWDDREVMYEKIEKRVDLMFENGLVKEVKALMDMGLTPDMVSMQGLGYKEVLEYLNGNISLERAKYLIKRDTRHFAKRQLTWLRREKDVRFIDIRDHGRDAGAVAKHIIKCCKDSYTK